MSTYTQSTSSNLTAKVWDKLLHERVADKMAFKDLIGKDKAGEGSVDKEVINKPIVEKTNLDKEPGDRITMGMVNNLGQTYNAGKTGNEALVGYEEALTFNYLNVPIAHWRNATVIEGKGTKKRSPFDLKMTAVNRLSQQHAQFKDTNIFNAFYFGYSPSTIRELGTSVCDPTNHPNRMFGPARANFAAMTSSDTLSVDQLERVAAYLAENNINPIMVDGEPHFLAFIHPRGIAQLRSDSVFRDLQASGMPRGDNWIFKGGAGIWANIVLRQSNKVDTPKAWGDATVTGSGTGASPYQISVSDDTPGAGLTVTDFRVSVVLGANAAGLAYGIEDYMEDLKETDYGNKFGIGGGSIFGVRRADWLDDAASSTTVNQSSLLVYNYSPAVTA